MHTELNGCNETLIKSARMCRLRQVYHILLECANYAQITRAQNRRMLWALNEYHYNCCVHLYMVPWSRPYTHSLNVEKPQSVVFDSLKFLAPNQFLLGGVPTCVCSFVKIGLELWPVERDMPKVRWVISYWFCSEFYTLSSSAKILKIG